MYMTGLLDDSGLATNGRMVGQQPVDRLPRMAKEIVMRLSRFLCLLTLLAVSAAAQEPAALSDEAAAFQKVGQLAALAPNSAELSESWSDYVVRFVGKDGDLDSAIDKVLAAADAFRREIRNPGGVSTGPAMPAYRLEELLREAANSALANAED
jgi:hypothetical protein